MDWQTIAAIATAVAAVIALGTAGTALWQVTVAKDQAASAWRAANAAEEQATAAEQQARAADEQVLIMRAQVEAAQRDRHSADRPVFTFGQTGNTGDLCLIIGRLERGPDELEVTVVHVLLRPYGVGPDYPPTDEAETTRHRVIPDGSFDVGVDLLSETEPTTVELVWECVELPDRHRAWSMRREFTFLPEGEPYWL